MVVLNGTTLEDPVEMDLALPLVAAAIGRVGENIRLPVTDKLAVEVELLRLLRCRPVGAQYCSEARRAPEPQHLRADPGVLREPIRFPALAPVQLSAGICGHVRRGRRPHGCALVRSAMK